MRDRHAPNDFWSVFYSMPFCKLVGGSVTIRFSFGQSHFGDPFVLCLACGADIAVG